jgi:hypothetical protein
MVEVSPHIRELYIAIGDEGIKIGHEFCFRQNRQLVERLRLRTCMKPAVKLGVSICMRPESAEFARLISCDLICGPTLTASEFPPH